MRGNYSDAENDYTTSEGVNDAMDQNKLLEEAMFYVKESSYYMRQALEAEDMDEALKRGVNVISELRTSSLTPTNYYELYMKVFNDLQMLSDFMGMDKKRGMSLQKLYETIQQCSFILPRLYLLIMAGANRIRASPALSNEILKDLTELCRGVQHPMRGLFLRYFLVQICKDSLPDAGKDDKEATMKSFEFLLWNFKESARLWVRMNSGTGNLLDMRRRNKERTELGLLVGSNLVRMAQLEGLDADFYTDTALPRILEVITEVHDMQARRYILDCLIQAFSDEYHLRSLPVLLKTIVSGIASDDCINVLTNLMQRLSQYFQVADLNAPETVPGDLFEIFNEHINSIDVQRDISMKAFLELQTSFLEFTSNVYPGIIEHIEATIRHVRDCIKRHMEHEGEMEDDTFDSVVKLHTIPLQSLGLRSLKIFENTWLKEFMPAHKNVMFSKAIVDAMVQYKVYIHDTDDLQTIFEFDCPFFAASGNQNSTSLEEEVYMSKFIQMIRANDPLEQFAIYRAVLDKMTSMKPFRNQRSVQTLMIASLKLVYRPLETSGDTTPSSKELSLEEVKTNIISILKFFNDMTRLIEFSMPEDALKLLIIAAVTVNELCTMLKLDMQNSADYDEFGVLCYNFIARACIIFEEGLISSKQQLGCLCYMLSSFCSKITVLNEDHYTEMSNRLCKYSLGLLKMEHKFAALAHLGSAYAKVNDGDRVKWALDKALKVAEGSKFETYDHIVDSITPVLSLGYKLRDSFDVSAILDSLDRYLQREAPSRFAS